jgi:hypothetical protein
MLPVSFDEINVLSGRVFVLYSGTKAGSPADFV